MISISVRIASNRFPGMSAKLNAGLRAQVQATGGEVRDGAKARVPVDTGALKGSIQSEMTGDTSALVTAGGGAVNYAGFVEYGTVHASAQPYMHPAADAATPQFVAGVARLLNDLA